MSQSAVVKHPGRYPVHEGDKGQAYGGECNVTRCERRGAVFWNMGTYGLYCAICAEGVNWRRDRPPLCVRVDDKPSTVEAMERFRTENRYYDAL